MADDQRCDSPFLRRMLLRQFDDLAFLKQVSAETLKWRKLLATATARLSRACTSGAAHKPWVREKAQ